MADTLRVLMKSVAQVARYLRQPIPWVESLELDELNRWSQVTSEILREERGGDSEGPPDPFRSLVADD